MDQRNYFVYKLIPPRPTFDVDATEDEQAIMAGHVAYWRDHLDQGRTLIFGPVSDSSGSWGLAVVQATDEHELHAIAARDPAIISGVCTYEIGTMRGAVVAAQHADGEKLHAPDHQPDEGGA